MTKLLQDIRAFLDEKVLPVEPEFLNRPFRSSPSCAPK
jgi:hypothetical protein